MQTNAVDDQLGSTGTATARAESMLVQLLQRDRTKLPCCLLCLGLVSYRPLAPGRRAILPLGHSHLQDYQTVAKIVARLVHATQAPCSSLFVYRSHTRRRLLCLRVLIATLAVARSRNRTVLQIAVRARDLQQKWH